MEQKNFEKLDVNQWHVRDAILYFTIQQYFQYSDKKTEEFIEQLRTLDHFDNRAGLKKNIPLLANRLQVSQKDFYQTYLRVKESFSLLDVETMILSRDDPFYSSLLRKTEEAPPFLFAKGNLDLLKEPSVSIVGSRNATEDDCSKTRALARALASRNFVIIAGLAKGIDTAAHEAALEANGFTIAVLGTPINQYYPKENKALQMKIEQEGLVLSQFPPCNPVNRWNFPVRNGVVSGLSLATIIIEAGQRSGSLRQADFALKQNRKVLIPYSLTQNTDLKWPVKYIEKGAGVFQTLSAVLLVLQCSSKMPNTQEEDEELFNLAELEYE